MQHICDFGALQSCSLEWKSSQTPLTSNNGLDSDDNYIPTKMKDIGWKGMNASHSCGCFPFQNHTSSAPPISPYPVSITIPYIWDHMCQSSCHCNINYLQVQLFNFKHVMGNPTITTRWWQYCPRLQWHFPLPVSRWLSAGFYMQQ